MWLPFNEFFSCVWPQNDSKGGKEKKSKLVFPILCGWIHRKKERKKEREREYLDEKIALAINPILNDLECLPIIYMEVHCIFHLWNVTHLHTFYVCTHTTLKPPTTTHQQKQEEEEDVLQHGALNQWMNPENHTLFVSKH